MAQKIASGVYLEHMPELAIEHMLRTASERYLNKLGISHLSDRIEIFEMRFTLRDL